MAISSRNSRVIALESVVRELKQYADPEGALDEGKKYKYTERVIDGRRYASMTSIETRNEIGYTPEGNIVNEFVKMLDESSEDSVRKTAPLARKVFTEYLKRGVVLRDTQLYMISKDIVDRAFRTTPRSVEREMLLITGASRLNDAYLYEPDKGS